MPAYIFKCLVCSTEIARFNVPFTTFGFLKSRESVNNDTLLICPSCTAQDCSDSVISGTRYSVKIQFRDWMWAFAFALGGPIVVWVVIEIIRWLLVALGAADPAH
jgi:hypothetical protein